MASSASRPRVPYYRDVVEYNTDLEAPAGRFQSQKERKETANAHLEAKIIDTTIVLSSINLQDVGEESRRTGLDEQNKTLLRDEAVETALRNTSSAACVSAIVGWILSSIQSVLACPEWKAELAEDARGFAATKIALSCTASHYLASSYQLLLAGSSPMSYQPLSQSEAEEGLPRYSGDAAVIGISSGTTASSTNNAGRASNYLHISDGKRITGTHHINTDLLPLAGRFDNAEDRDKTPNVYLEATYIDVELILSGSKKAKIVISDTAYTPSTNRSYSRHIIRITHGGGDASIAKHGPTLFDLEVDQYSHGRAVVSVEPRAFTGFVNGSFKFSEEMQKIATCVVSRPGNSRWLVSPTGSIPAQAQGEITSSSEPTASNSASDGDDTTLVSNLTTTCSSILFKNGKDKEAADTPERRIVCSTAEYEESRAELFAMERYYVRVWYALAAVWLAVLAGLIYIGLHASYAEDGQMHVGYIVTLMLGGLVQFVAGIIMLVAPIV